MEKEVKQEKKQFIYDWYKELNWRSNPFEYRYLFPVANYISGYVKERKKLNLFIIEKSPLCLIRGNEGFGKTTLLLWLKYELSKYKDRIMLDYINKHVNLADFVKLLIRPFLNFKEKTVIATNVLHIGKIASLIKDANLKSIYESVYLKKKDLDFASIKNFLSSKLGNKHLVLLVDDIDQLTEQAIKFIEMLINSDLNLQIILSSNTGSLDIISKKKDVVKVELDSLAYEDAKDMLSKRIISVGGIGVDPFSEEQLKALHQKCNKSPLVFLNLCKDRAIRIALNKVNEARNIALEQKTQGLNEVKVSNENTGKSEEVKESKKTYEIKVVSSDSSSPYEIKMVKPKEEGIAIKVEKEARSAVKVEKEEKAEESKQTKQQRKSK